MSTSQSTLSIESRTNPKLVAFISYAHQDAKFRKRLMEALEGEGLSVSGDADLPVGEEFGPELERLIEDADVFIFVVSADSVTSVPCRQEINCAEALKKRVLPVVAVSGFDNDKLHRLVASTQWTLLRSEDNFAEGIARLMRAVNTNVELTKTHTWLTRRAMDWKLGQKGRNRLLLGEDLTKAQEWLPQVVANEREYPRVTPLQQEYIIASDRNKARTNRWIAGIALAVAAVVGVACLFALFQYNVAKKQLYAARLNLVRQYWETSQIGDMQRLLEEYRDDTELRGFEWWYQWKLCHSYLRAERPSGEFAAKCTCDSQGRRLAWIEPDATGAEQITVKDCQTGRLSSWPVRHAKAVERLQFSPQNDKLATVGGETEVRIWDVATGALLGTLEGHTSAISALAFSKGKPTLLTIGQDRVGRLWDLRSFRQLQEFKTAGTGPAAAISPDGTKFAYGDDETVCVVDLSAPDQQHRLEGHLKGPPQPDGNGRTILSISCLDFSPDGTRLASGAFDQTVRVWDINVGKEVLTLFAHNDSLCDIAFSPDGAKLASAGYDRTVKVWEAANGRLLAWLKGHSSPLARVTFSEDSAQLVSLDIDHELRVWDARRAPEDPDAQWNLDHPKSLAFRSDGNRLAVCDNAGIHIYDGRMEREVTSFPVGDWGMGFQVAYSPSGSVLATANSSMSDNVLLWNAETGQRIRVFQGHTREARAVAFHPKMGYLASGSWDGTVRVWDVESGNQIHLLKSDPADDDAAVESVAFHSDRLILASGESEGRICLWDADSGTLLKSIRAHASSVRSLAFSPDGNWLASSGEDRVIRLWNTQSCQLDKELHGHQNPVWSLTFDRDVRRLVTGSFDSTARIWDLGTGQELLSLSAADPVWAVAFSPVGRRLATAGNGGAVKMWDVEDK